MWLTRCWSKFVQVLVKMDIEGGECEALDGAAALFASGKVVGVYMEAGQV